MIQTINLIVKGMKCGGCEANIVEKLTALAGVESAEANFKENIVNVHFNANQLDVEALEEVIIAAGFSVE